MKRHAIYFALALAGAAFTLQAAPLPAMPDPSLPVSHFITQVNADKSITYRLFAPDARRVSIVTGATPDSFVSHDMTKAASGSGSLPLKLLYKLAGSSMLPLDSILSLNDAATSLENTPLSSKSEKASASKTSAHL